MKSTSYSFSAPSGVWEAFTDTVPKNKNIDDAIVEVIAERAAEANGQLSDRQRQQIEMILDGGEA